jgi:hypothetical protein
MDTYDLMPLSATDSCAQTSAGYVCTKALEHVGEHATHTAGGVVIKRWPNTQITPGDAVKDAAPASSGAPSLVELDRREAAQAVLQSALDWAEKWADAPRGAYYGDQAEEVLHDAARDFYKAVQS